MDEFPAFAADKFFYSPTLSVRHRSVAVKPASLQDCKAVSPTSERNDSLRLFNNHYAYQW